MAGLMRSAVVSALFGLLVGPGPIAVVIPWLITHWRGSVASDGWLVLQLFGGLLIVLGLPALVASIARFVYEGRGTLAPMMPTEALVVRGAYRYVRNPMYVGVLAMIFGQALVFFSWPLAVYGVAVAAAFDLFVRFYEEPTLTRTHGAAYEQFRAKVPRWLPRLTPWEGDRLQ